MGQATLDVKGAGVSGVAPRFRDILAIQWHGWLLTVITLAPIPIGWLIKGNSVFDTPFPVATGIAIIWFAFNGFLCFIGSALSLRAIWLFRTSWTRQEIWVFRGAFYLTVGGGMGYWTRAFLRTAHITIATPYLSAGALCVIYGMWKLPERFSDTYRGASK